MAEDGPTLGGLDLGSPNAQDTDSKPSIFGNTTAQTNSAFQLTAGGLVKSGTGFGALGNFDQKSPFADPSSLVANPRQHLREEHLVLNQLILHVWTSKL